MTYSYEQRSQIIINYSFNTIKVASYTLNTDIPETFQLANLKSLYLIIILLAALNLYFEISSIKQALHLLYSGSASSI